MQKRQGEAYDYVFPVKMSKTGPLELKTLSMYYPQKVYKRKNFEQIEIGIQKTLRKAGSVSQNSKMYLYLLARKKKKDRHWRRVHAKRIFNLGTKQYNPSFSAADFGLAEVS